MTARSSSGTPAPTSATRRSSALFVDLVHVYVDDVDAHYERAVAAGATIHQPPEDAPYGDRRYDAEDPEGHRWSFAQLLREVEPEEWGATAPARATRTEVISSPLSSGTVTLRSVGSLWRARL